MLVLLILAAPPPPSSAYVQIRNQGISKGYARTINCSGSGVTCAVNTTTAEATLTVNLSDAGSGGSWDGGPAIPACAAGFVLDADGGVLYCTNVIATATALAANPTDCSAGQYANAIAASGNLTCAAVGYSQLSGSPIAGGSNPQVQYNNGGVLGGMTNVTSDGTHLSVVAVSTMPSTPATDAIHYDWRPSAAWPQIPFMRDAFTGTAVPQGVLDSLGEGASANNWMFNCIKEMDVGSTPYGHYSETATTSGWSTHSVAWATTSLLTRLPWMLGSTGTGAGAQVSLLQPRLTTWLGNSSGAGGFIFWNRIALHASPTHARWFFGLTVASSGFANVEPSSLTNTVYYGCDNGASPDSNLHICSNDTSGSATCSDLGSNYPCHTADAIYDLWLAAAPQAALPDGGTGISYYIERLDSSHSTTGTVSSDLPQNTVQIRWMDEANAADGGAVVTGYFHAACLASNQ